MAAKLGFREWDKSEEVFDVDIWLSRGDVWVGHLYSRYDACPALRRKDHGLDYVIVSRRRAQLLGGHTQLLHHLPADSIFR